MTAATVQSVGFVGLGNAGWPMAEQLLAAGFELVVRDGDAERTRSFVAGHGVRDGTPSASFSDVDVLFTMLPDGDVVRAVLLGDGGIAGHLVPGTIVVDTSSSNPIGTRELAGKLASRGIRLVDAAVSEARVGDAKRGAITFMVGADDEATLERVRPLLQAMSAHIFRVGPTGAGHAMKTLNNYISAAGLHAALDSLIAGHRFGVDLATMIDAFNVSTARNLSTEGTMRNKALPRRFERRYSLGMLAKDMGIAASLARATGFECDELFRLLERAFAAARDDVGFDEDLTASLLHWERRAGVELPATEPNEQLADVRPEEPGAVKSLAIGLTGLGETGAAVAVHLLAAGHRVVVHDADSARAARFAAEQGAGLAATPAGLAGMDVLLVVAGGDEAVRRLLFGPDLAGRLAPGAVVVHIGAFDPEATRRLAAELARAGLSLVDAGVSVPHIGALTEGRINFMLGADDEQALARAASVLATMSAHTFAAGRAGAGHAVSLLNDYIAAAGLRGALDGLIVGDRYGLDPAAMLDVLNLSTGRNFSTEQTLRLYALPRRYETGCSIASLVESLARALAFARELEIGTELLELVHRDFAAALEQLGEGDVASLLPYWERKTGTELPTSPSSDHPTGSGSP